MIIPYSNQNILSFGLYKTDAIPLSHTEFLNIERLKSDLKNSPVRLDLAYFQPKDNFLFISGSSLHFLKWCSKSLIEKRIHNTFQIHRL